MVPDPKCARTPLPSGGLTIRTLPSGPLYLWELAGDKNLSSAVLQNVSIVNDSEAPLALRSVTFEVMRGDTLVQMRNFTASELEEYAGYMHGSQQQGVIDAYNFVFRPDLLLGEGCSLSPTTSLAPGQGLFLASHAILTPEGCDRLRINAEAAGDDGREVQSATELRLTEYQAKNAYCFPVNGTWYVSAGADFFSGHRWVVCQEFGLDLVRLGESGGFHTGRGLTVESHYGYGSEVMATADGIVVKAVDRFPDSSNRLPGESESNEEHWGRLLATASEWLVGEPARAAGNHVLISHDGGEYSLYGHLQPESISVEEGEHVQAGRVIGRLGHSGNSPFPHLHFHVCDGEDFMYARTLPVKFSNISVLQRPTVTGYLHTGDIVSTHCARAKDPMY